MTLAFVAQWEWLLILGLVLCLAIGELVALRRSQRRDREAAAGGRSEHRAE